MADTAATVPAESPSVTDAEIPAAADKCVVTIPQGVLSVALPEEIPDLEVSYDEGTTWFEPSSTAGFVVWSSRRAAGATIWMRKTSGTGTYPLLGRDHL